MAVEAFQEAYNENYKLLGGSGTISVDGEVGKQTWGAIFDLYQYNMAQELGETLEGVDALRDLMTFLPDVDPFIGFGESAPVDGVAADAVESQANRRVEVLFFEKGQEPDLALLAEDPKASELCDPSEYSMVALTTASVVGGFDQQVQLVDEETLEGVPGVPYVFLDGDQASLSGTTDASGYTERTPSTPNLHGPLG